MSTRSLNKVMLIGNLTRDPELRYTPSGTAVATFGMATNRSWTSGDGGERQEDTQFHRIVAWSKLAEICEQLLFKGRKVYIEGRLQTRKWTTQDGQQRETTEVVAENMMILDNRTRDGGEDNSHSQEDDWVDVSGDDTIKEEEVPSGDEGKQKKSTKSPTKSESKSTPKEDDKEGDIVDVDEIPF